MPKLFCPELKAFQVFSVFFRPVFSEHPGRRHAMTHDIHGKQIFIIPVQISLQSGHLAGNPAEQHMFPFIQKLFNFAVNRAYPALDIFRTTQFPQFLRRTDNSVFRRKLFVHCHTAYTASCFQYILGQKSKNSSGRTFHPYLILCISSKTCRLLSVRKLRRQLRARPHAFPAVDADFFFHIRVQKTVPVFSHFNRIHRTAVKTCRTAAAPLFRQNLNIFTYLRH